MTYAGSCRINPICWDLGLFRWRSSIIHGILHGKWGSKPNLLTNTLDNLGPCGENWQSLGISAKSSSTSQQLSSHLSFLRIFPETESFIFVAMFHHQNYHQRVPTISHHDLLKISPMNQAFLQSRSLFFEGPLWCLWCRAGGRSPGTLAEELAWQPGVENPLQLVSFPHPCLLFLV